MSGRNPYLATQNTVETPRQLEYRLFSSVTRALMEVRPLMGSTQPAEVAKIAAAIGWNRDVWNHLMPEVLDEKNALSKDVKVSLINICIFVNKHTDAITQGTSIDIEPLIEINRNIMDGLR
ncbi:MAG TPA: flagellar biosynthesis regulator FlaF [Ferrovibrio sp.]|jgi:flagellar protein FlaF|uniref:flagellar biosynthesis regulator FlaF n=1 Tax=Ferrovibrio sp. TaxID=1917215 RepID=UPI002B4ADFBC|nr:flagellar biosynthesis regulator FlaF [Ferrovibrio sp.]HLT78185.1 flagellar biosynthesis regulator FlaF [Ferrovibrio sp.]